MSIPNASRSSLLGVGAAIALVISLIAAPMAAAEDSAVDEEIVDLVTTEPASVDGATNLELIDDAPRDAGTPVDLPPEPAPTTRETDTTSPDLADPPDSSEESADEPSEDSPGTEPDPAPVEPTSMARSAMNVLSTTDGDTPVTYPVNLPDGYSKVPFSVQYFPGVTGYYGPLVCVLVSEQYAVEIIDVPPDPATGYFYFSDPGSPDWATRTPFSSEVDGIDLGGQMCKPISYNHPFGSQFPVETLPEVPLPGASDEERLQYYITVATAKANHVTIWWNGANFPPEASFTWEVTDLGERTVTFTNTSTDDGAVGLLRYEWNFGDGSAVSTDTDPVHRFPGLGSYRVSLTATDDAGVAHTTTQTVTVGSGLVVNSTGDAAAEDPADGCDTGETIGTDDVPECTLRAAIEAANAAGGGEITFDIDGTPVIALGSPLPALTTSTLIDGTSQAGGWVEVVGGGAATIELSAGTSRVTGLSLHGAERALSLTGGDGHVVEGTRLGVDLEAQATGDTATGVWVTDVSPNAVLRDNLIAADWGVLATGVPLAQLSGNRIGVDEAGAALGAPAYGIQLFNAPVSVADNTVRATAIGIAVIAESGVAGDIVGNRVGTAGKDGFADAGTGIVVEGAVGTRVADNTVHAGGWGGILVAGSIQVSADGDGGIEYAPPADLPRFSAPASSSGVRVTGNSVSTSTGATAIGSWADADAIEVAGNTLSFAQSQTGIHLIDGADHSIVDNIIGLSGDVALARTAIWLEATESPVVDENEIQARGAGVFIEGAGSGADITDNLIAIDGDAPDSFGIIVGWDRTGVTISRNTVAGAGSNGIQAEAPGAVIDGNEVTGSGNGIAVAGNGIVIRDNAIGIAAGQTDTVGNLGNGIAVESGRVEIRANTIVGSGASGIQTNPGAVATIRGNRIWDTAGSPINGPLNAPKLEAAIVADSDSTMRTTLLITGLPSEQDGTIEIFANDSCSANDGEARYAPGILRATTKGRAVMIIQVTGSSDHFTITYTTPAGQTSELSKCRSRTVHPDTDGDGSADPLDDLMDASDDPSIAVLATSQEQLLVAVASSGAIERLGVVADPAPASHPTGWSLPYGTLSFRISDLEPGGRTTVVLTTYFQDEPLAGSAYWKYGLPTPGAEATWYDFRFDPVTQTGATRASADVPGLGFRTAYTLQFADGARGDDDGAMNGSVTDPGGPVVVAGTSPELAPAPSVEMSEKLASTGSTSESSGAALGLAVVAVLLGAGLLRFGVRRSRRREG